MSSFSYSSTSYSSSSSTRDGQTTSSSYSRESQSDASGSTVRHTSQRDDGPAVQETRYYDPTGREVPADADGRRLGGTSGDKFIEGGGSNGNGNSNNGSNRRIEDVTDGGNDGGYREPQEGESEADAAYRERMEDEYAKREGGA